MILDPEELTHDERLAVGAWLKANGAREAVAREPVVIHGRHVTFQAMWRRSAPKATQDAWIRAHMGRDGWLGYEPRTLRIRVPLSAFLELPTVLHRIDLLCAESGLAPLERWQRPMVARSISDRSMDPEDWVERL